MNEINKRIIFCSSIIALIAALAALSIAPKAHADQGCNQHANAHASKPMPPPGLPPRVAMGLLPPMLQAELSDAQDAQVFELTLNHAKQAHPLERRVAKTLEQLHQLTRQEPFDQAQAAKLADKLGAASAALTLLQSQLDAQIIAVLSPEQKAALAMGPRPMPAR